MGKQRIDKPEDVKMQEYIESRAHYSLSVLGLAFTRHGSGEFLNIRSGPPKRYAKKKV